MRTAITKIAFAVMLLIGVNPSHAEKARTAWIWPNPLLGAWANVDADARGLIRVIIKASNGGVTVDAGFDTRSPNSPQSPIWSGPVPAILYSESVESPKAVAFRAQYKDSLGPTTIVGQLRGQVLEVQLFTEFTDGSGRYNYHLAAKMVK